MTATHRDALQALRTQVPERLYRFAELVADGLVHGHADVLERAAAGVGAPGQSHALMSDPRTSKVLHAITGADGEAFRDVRVQAIRMLALLCSFDPADAVDETNRFLPLRSIPPECRSAIESYELKADGSIKIRFVKRLDALRLLLQYFGDIENRALAVGGHATVIFRGRGQLE